MKGPNPVRVLRWIQKLPFMSEERLLELYPPFFFIGLKVKQVASDFRSMTVVVPFRWYLRNMHNSMFGGILCAASDPLPALLCEKIFKNIEVWSKKQTIEFLKPARSNIRFDVSIPEEAVVEIEKRLREASKAEWEFEFEILDDRDRVVGRVRNTVYMKNKSPALDSHGEPKRDLLNPLDVKDKT